MSAHNQIKSLMTGDHAVAGLYVALLGAILGDLIPTPADPLYFWYTRRLRIQMENKEITPGQYWAKETAAYYFFNSGWWLLVLIVAISIKGDLRRKATVVGGVLGAGAMIGVIYKNITKDTEYFKNKALVDISNAYSNEKLKTAA